MNRGLGGVDGEELRGGARATVVFHCMESVRRGPRCARRLRAYFDGCRSKPCSVPSIRVLEGGADQWVRRFYGDPSKVEDFDDEYWGFCCVDSLDNDRRTNERSCISIDQSKQCAKGTKISSAEQIHRLYRRPDDQPETPWSGAGSLVMSKKI